MASGNWSTSMIRPRNWLSRRLSSLVIEPTSTVNDASVTLVPSIVIDPVIWLLRPAAVVLTPNRTSSTR